MRHTAAVATVLTVLVVLLGALIGFAVLVAPPITMARRGRWSVTSVVLWLIGVVFLFGWGPDLQFGESGGDSGWLDGWEQPVVAVVAATLAVLTVPRRSAAGRPTR